MIPLPYQNDDLHSPDEQCRPFGGGEISGARMRGSKIAQGADFDPLVRATKATGHQFNQLRNWYDLLFEHARRCTLDYGDLATGSDLRCSHSSIASDIRIIGAVEDGQSGAFGDLDRLQHLRR